MPKPSHRPQRGQILVIFAGGLVTLLVIAALVIDVGFTFMIRRAEQNAADPGAIAAARYIPSGNYAGMVAAACFYAQQNGFFTNAPGYPTDTGCVPANDPFATTLTVNWPPSAGAGPSLVGDPGKVEVILGRNHNSFLAGIIGITRIGVATNAVAAFDDGNSNSSSLIALDPGGCTGSPAGMITGGGTVEIVPVTPGIDGGYVHINSNCGTGATGDDFCDNSGGASALKVDGGGTLVSPGVYIVGSCKNTGTITTSTLDEGSVLIGDPLSELPPPSFSPPGAWCGVPFAPGVNQTTEAGAEGCKFNNGGQTYELSPGVYYGGWRINGSNVTLHLDPGIYVIAGGGITLGSSGTISSVELSTGVPAPVMIFSTDDPMYAADCKSGGGTASQCQDKLDFSANSDLLLHGLTSGPYKGILMWQDGNGSGVTAGPKLDINLSGQTSISLTGTIYNPRGVVTLSGGSIASGFASVQIISWRWKIDGSGTLHMPYDPNELYQFNSKGLVR
jgi:hypothetical protein